MDLIRAIIDLSQDRFSIKIFEGLEDIPHFNPDLDTETAPPAVASLRKLLRAADGILICTPEYAMGVPGSLKNAIDWTVSSCEFSRKPVALITASSIGEKAHESLLGTLRIIEADIKDETALLIPFIRTKVNREGKITDEATLNEVKKLIEHFSN